MDIVLEATQKETARKIFISLPHQKTDKAIVNLFEPFTDQEGYGESELISFEISKNASQDLIKRTIAGVFRKHGLKYNGSVYGKALKDMLNS